MKKLLLSIAAAALLLNSCNGKKTEEHGHDHTEGTHQHADGEAHEDHEEQAQQEFTVSKDTTAIENHDHQHQAGEDHQH